MKKVAAAAFPLFFFYNITNNFFPIKSTLKLKKIKKNKLEFILIWNNIVIQAEAPSWTKLNLIVCSNNIFIRV